MGKFNVTVTDVSGQIHDRYQMPTQINGSYVGGTGGQTTQVQLQQQLVILLPQKVLKNSVYLTMQHQTTLDHVHW
jgi:hypothetical protein